MSISEFHSQLTQADQPDTLIAALGRLTTAGDPEAIERLISPPSEPFTPVWTGGLTAQ
jgi:hypothetical protein